MTPTVERVRRLLDTKGAGTRELVRSAALSPFQPAKFFVDQYSVGQLFTRWLFIPAAFQLWFLRTLLLLTALYPWLRTAVTRWPRAFFIAATLYWIPGDGLPILHSEGLLFYDFDIEEESHSKKKELSTIRKVYSIAA